jgi:hypothetical protein
MSPFTRDLSRGTRQNKKRTLTHPHGSPFEYLYVGLRGFCFAAGRLVLDLFLQAQRLDLIGAFAELGDDLFLGRSMF